ncbi:Uncharacterised protein [uncultured archaeon]|nr:Uncharacterised protein [uncultured archaeon]
MKTITFLALSILAFYFVTINEYFISFLVLISMVIAIVYEGFKLPHVEGHGSGHAGSAHAGHDNHQPNIGASIGSIFDWFGRSMTTLIRALSGEPKPEKKAETGKSDGHH